MVVLPREYGRLRLLRQIRQAGRVPRIELASQTGMSRAVLKRFGRRHKRPDHVAGTADKTALERSDRMLGAMSLTVIKARYMSACQVYSVSTLT